MTTKNLQADACQPDSLSSKDVSEDIRLPIHPEWIPLDEIAKAWADLSFQVTSALAFQAVGTAFLALSFETSAHKHYTLAYHRLWRRIPFAVAQDLDHAITDLLEAWQQWASTNLWLERFANEECGEEETLAIVRTLFRRIQAQQHRLWLLLQRLQEEQHAGVGQPLVVHLSPAPPAAHQEESHLHEH